MKKKISKEQIQQYKNLEEEFFNLDKEQMIAHICFEYDKPSDLFDEHFIGNIPIFSADLYDRVLDLLFDIPKKYSLEIDFRFLDMEDYSKNFIKRKWIQLISLF